MRFLRSVKQIISKVGGNATLLADSFAGSVSDPFSGTITSDATFPSGTILKQSFYTIGEGTMSGNDFPNDDTAPQRSEGDEIWSYAYTPLSDTNSIIIRASIKLGESGSDAGNAQALGLFISDQNDAIVVCQANEENNRGSNRVNYLHAFILKSISSWTGEKTLSLRSSGATSYNYFTEYNTFDVGTKYNNKINSSVVIMEVK